MSWLDLILPQDKYLSSRLIYLSQQTSSAVLGNFLVSTLMMLALITTNDSWHVALWWLALNLMNLPRLVMSRQYCKLKPNDKRVVSHGLTFLSASMMITASTWAVGMVIFYDPHSLEIMSILSIIATGVVGGGIGTMAVAPRLYIAYASAVLIPLTAQNLMQDSLAFQVVAILSLIYGVIMVMTSKRLHGTIISALSSQNQMADMAMRDSLTDIPNRRAFEERLHDEWQRAIRSGLPISLIILDIDLFKQYNDHFGHGKGDAVIKTVANALKNNTQRNSDLVCRIGGEEFAVILPDTDLHGARILGEHLNNAVSQQNIAHHSDVAERVTISVGASMARPQRGDFVTTLFDAADQALYTAKQKGRNCVVAAPSQRINITP